MSRKLIDHSGEIYNGITIISISDTKTGTATKYNCVCHCGVEFITTHTRLKDGKTKSCGCQRYNKFIDDKYTYSSYNAMIQRCTNENHDSYHKYGGSGIVICERWLLPNGVGFSNFIEDMGSRPENHSINRINSSHVYSKETCEWASTSMQSFDQNVRQDNPSGITGVKYRNDRNKWSSFIYVNDEFINLYYGDSMDDAIKARTDAELKYYGFEKGKRHG